jgi:hypothetical protein
MYIALFWRSIMTTTTETSLLPPTQTITIAEHSLPKEDMWEIPKRALGIIAPACLSLISGQAGVLNKPIGVALLGYAAYNSFEAVKTFSSSAKTKPDQEALAWKLSATVVSAVAGVLFLKENGICNQLPPASQGASATQPVVNVNFLTTPSTPQQNGFDFGKPVIDGSV